MTELIYFEILENLNQFSPHSKIINQNHNEEKENEEKSQNNINSTLNKYNLEGSNFFYLPRKYFEEKLFGIICYLSFLKIPNEISIPFIINILEKKRNKLSKI